MGAQGVMRHAHIRFFWSCRSRSKGVHSGASVVGDPGKLHTIQIIVLVPPLPTRRCTNFAIVPLNNHKIAIGAWAASCWDNETFKEMKQKNIECIKVACAVEKLTPQGSPHPAQHLAKP
eukprot:829024-Amphidinium_carterae.1